MILTCPHCAIRYILPALALAPEGHRVKCTSCNEIWLQLPDPNELKEALLEQRAARRKAASADQEIPESVKPRDDAGLSLFPADKKKAQKERGGFAGYVMAACLFLVIAAVLYVKRDALVAKWLPAVEVYDLAHIPVATPGADLVFQSVTVTAQSKEADKGETLKIEGHILNQAGQPRKIPKIEATLRGPGGETLGQWLIDAPQAEAEPWQDVTFAAEYPSPDKTGKDIHFRFILENQAAAAHTDVAIGAAPPPEPEDHH